MNFLKNKNMEKKCFDFTSEHPPHCHLRCLRRILLSHEHSVKSPREHERVIDHAKAAALMACI